MNPYLYPQSDILTNIRTLLSEPTAERWTDVQIYQCINMALNGWQGRVRVPYIYTITGGWVSGTYDYALPSYIGTKTVQPQAKMLLYDWVESEGDETWTDIQAFDVEPNTSGGMTLRLSYNQPRSDVVGASTEGRVIWWGQPGEVPTIVPTLAASITSSDTSLTVSTGIVGRVGYVKIGNEWIGYAGTATSGAGVTTLQNLTRGLSGTTAAAHNFGDSVYWGVAVDTPSLLNALYDGARMYLMDLWLSNPSSRETAQYEKQLVLFQDRLERFWKGYHPSRAPRLRLSRQAIGDL